MNIGDYVRTKDDLDIQRICKIKKTYSTNDFFFTDYGYWDEENIIKSSPNIIDLIEVGDYVNGCLVLFAGAVTWDNDGNILDKRVHINRSGNDFWLSEKFIETVVTKEQFESMQYKVGGTNENNNI